MPKNKISAHDDELIPSSTNKHRKINPKPTTSIDDFSTTTSSSAQEEEEVVIVDLDCEIGSKLLLNFYKNISKFKLDSNIIINNNIFLSNEIIYHTKHYSQSIPPQLLYRGSRDGFKSIDFHSKCDNQGPTLTIIKSEHNQIFGGFTTENWNFSYKPISDDSAFIFKIDDGENKFRKFNIKQDKKHNAIYINTKYLPVFGRDICIDSDCNLNYNSSSNFGFAYELPTTTTTNKNELFKYGSKKATSYLAGSSNFKVNEIEVFKINKQLETTEKYLDITTLPFYDDGLV